MANERRGVRGMRTMSELHDQRRTRTSAGALIELSAMANEKLLLEREVERAARRNADIRHRLKEIAAKESRLMKFVSGAAPEAALGTDPQPSTAPQIETVPAPSYPMDSRFKVSEFSY